MLTKRATAKAMATPKTEQLPAVPVQGLAGEMAAVGDERAERLALIRQDCNTPEEFAAEIQRLWHQTKVRVLLIGRYLLDAKEKLTKHGEYEDFIKSHLPFGPEVARQIKAVAEAVYRTKRLNEAELPSSYSVAYHLTTLSDDQLAAAREQGLAHEGVTRRQIIDFKKSMAPTAPAPVRIAPSVEELIAEKARLKARLVEIEDALVKAGVIDM
jgi:hypothetical protein